MRRLLSKRVHGYYFLICFLLAAIFGIVVGAVLHSANFTNLSVLVLAIIFIVISCIRFRLIFLILIFLAGFMIGLWRVSMLNQVNLEIKTFIGSTVTVKGVVMDDTVTAPDGSLRFKLTKISINQEPLSGEVWVSSKASAVIKRSDTVTARGYLNKGFASFSASLVRSEILSIEATSSEDVGLKVRDNFARSTDAIPNPERALGLGFLLGLKANLPESLQQQIQTLGLTHIVVASGYNLTILVAFARRLFVGTSKYLSALFGGSMIFGFTLITGFSPSMSRAALVAGLSLLAWYYGRKIHPISLLIITAALTLLIHPAYIFGDLGWYLSFAAFFGILVLAPLIHHYFWGIQRQPSALRELIVATFAAQVLTLPIILYSFGIFSLYALPANLLILPIIPFAMLAVFLTGLAGLLVPFITEVVALPARIMLDYCTKIIDWLAALPNARLEITINFWQLVLFYLVIFVITIWLMLRTKHNFLKDKMIID